MRFRLAAAGCAALAVCSTLGLGCTATVTTNPPAETISPPAGCQTDSSLNCVGGGDGWSCTSGTNPEQVASGLSCSIPQSDAQGNDDFCCITWAPTTTSSCSPDDTITTGCQYPSFGYKCGVSTDDPTSLDSSLNCSPGVADPDGTDTDFCCQ